MEGRFILAHGLIGFSPSWQRVCQGKATHIMVAREGREARKEGEKKGDNCRKGKDGGRCRGRGRESEKERDYEYVHMC